MKLLVTIVLFAFVYFMLFSLNNTMQEMDDEYKSNIGKEIILEKDTLTIVDYSLWDETYTLSNGVKVSTDFIKK